MTLRSIWLLTTLLISQLAAAQTSVYQVTKGERQLYIAGTVHMLPASAFPLPAAFDNAYQHSSVVVFEADIRQMETAQGMQLLMQHARYQDGSTLKQRLSTDTYQALNAAALTLGVDINALDSFKPDFVVLMLMQKAMERAKLNGEGVDNYYLKRAQQDKRPLLFLETIEQQLTMLMNASATNEDAFVTQSLVELSDVEQQLSQITDAWRRGDTSKLAALAMSYIDTPEGAAFYDQLLVQRNKNWLPQLAQMLETPEIELVLVGALHLSGDNSVLQLLREQGYQIKQL